MASQRSTRSQSGPLRASNDNATDEMSTGPSNATEDSTHDSPSAALPGPAGLELNQEFIMKMMTTLDNLSKGSAEAVARIAETMERNALLAEQTAESRKAKARKIPEPRVYKGKNITEYNTFCQQLEQYFEDSKDVYDMERQRVRYAQSRMEANLAQSFDTKIQAGELSWETCTMEEFKEFLLSLLGNANFRELAAYQKFAKEEYKVGQDWTQFMQAKHQAWQALDKDLTKLYLHHVWLCLPTVVRETLSIHRDKIKSHEDLLTAGLWWQDFHRTQQRLQREAAVTGKQRFPSGASTNPRKRSSEEGGQEPPQKAKKPWKADTPAKRAQFQKEGRCFACGNTEHRSAECPQNKEQKKNQNRRFREAEKEVQRKETQ